MIRGERSSCVITLMKLKKKSERKLTKKEKKMHNNLEEEKKNIQKTRITKVKMQSVVTMTMIKKIS